MRAGPQDAPKRIGRPRGLMGIVAEEAAVELTTTIRMSGDVSILDLEGRVTIGESCERLATELLELIRGGGRKILINLRSTQQMDSSGISTLVRAYVSLRRSGGSLKLLAPQGRVRTVLTVTRLIKVLPVFDDEAAALDSFK